MFNVWTKPKLDYMVGYIGNQGSYVSSFNKTTRRRKCGLTDRTHIQFPLILRGSLNESGMRDVDVIEVIQFAKPTIMDKWFFQKMFYLVAQTCKDEQVRTI